jgi:hypothetical protein
LLIAVLLGLSLGAGCGKDDLNKDLKPVDPNVAPPGQGAFQTGADDKAGPGFIKK